MFNAKVHTVSNLFSSIALEEEHIVREVIDRWNIEEGEKHEVVFLTIPNNYRDITPDIYIFVIDNYVDENKVEKSIQTGAKVMLFFNRHHDANNTMASELKAIDDFREKVQVSCVCIDYKNSAELDQQFTEYLNSMITK